MNDADSLDFQWAGIDFRLQPRPSAHADVPVVLEWRHPSGEAGSRRFARVSEAMQHSSRMTALMAGARHASA